MICCLVFKFFVIIVFRVFFMKVVFFGIIRIGFCGFSNSWVDIFYIMLIMIIVMLINGF